MAFFGFEENSLEKEKQNFQTNRQENEDLAVYTWGEDSYDGLGDALQEGGDDFNDETFGGGGAVGKDFDFSGTGAPAGQPGLAPAAAASTPPPASNTPSIWDDKSLSSFLPRANGASRAPGRLADHQPRQGSPLAQPISQGISQKGGVRTVQEIEAEMRAVALHQAREANFRQRQLQEVEGQHHMHQHQEALLQQQLQREQLLLLQKEEDRARQQDLYMQQQLRQQEMRQLDPRQQELRQLELRQQEQLRLQELRQHEHRQQELRQQDPRQQDLRQQDPRQQDPRGQDPRQQEQQNQLQRLWEHQQMQQYQNLHQRTPPPRMLPQSQSPRFQDNLYQRQLLLLQQQQQEQEQQQQQGQQQQQLRMQELQEQLRMEELEKQLRAQHLHGSNQSPVPFNGRRQHNASPSLAEIQAIQAMQHQRQRSGSPAFDGAYSHETQHRIQLQQRLVSEMVQAELMRDMQGASPAEKEALRAEAMRKILEAEKMEEKRRRKASKINYMSRYNDLMTQSDKDFITRIQVSQLVTQDPYAEDFYAQVYGAILRSRMGLQTQDERVLKFGSSGGVGLGLAKQGGSRRPNAMQRMEQQVERIVSNAKLREKEKHSFNSLQGALGKTSGRSYKAAPRQLLQVDASNASTSPTLAHASAHISREDAVSPQNGVTTAAAEEAAKLGREALGATATTEQVDGLVPTDPLTNRQALIILEGLYDVVLTVEQLRRDEPPIEVGEEAYAEWQSMYEEALDEIFSGLKVMAPLEISNPHPFISLLGPAKGKKLLPRISRYLGEQQMLTMLTLLVARFDQLDVVKDGPILDSFVESNERSEAERQTHTFLGTVMQSVIPVVAKGGLRLITGLLSLLLDRTDITAVAYTKPGIAMLTLFLSQVEVIKQNMSSNPDGADYPTAEEAQQWQSMFDHLFQLLSPSFMQLFPSTRMAPTMPIELANDPSLDILDQPVWSFLAAVALHGVPHQHQFLVTAVREKVLHNVMTVNKGWVADEDTRQTKLANVNVFLHALGLDSSHITM